MPTVTCPRCGREFVIASMAEGRRLVNHLPHKAPDGSKCIPPDRGW